MVGNNRGLGACKLGRDHYALRRRRGSNALPLLYELEDVLTNCRELGNLLLHSLEQRANVRLEAVELRVGIVRVQTRIEYPTPRLQFFDRAIIHAVTSPLRPSRAPAQCDRRSTT